MANTVQGESSSTSGASNSTPTWKYDVFLSFRGEDTRLTITDHLYHALSRSGIRIFRDNERIERGEVISAQLSQAIEDSRCAVVVLSQNYADSRWCLNELQQILQSMKKLGRRVFPIFYDVDPSDVRNQRKRFGEALANLEKRLRGNMDTVKIWKNSLSEIGNIAGWDARSRPQTQLIEEVVGAVWKYLCSRLPSYDDNLVGIEQKMADLMSCLEIGLDDIRFVGIWAMGGAGKTTLARVVYEKISDRFEMCCFLANVRETLQKTGLVSLHKKLLSPHGIKEDIPDDYEGMKMIRKLFCNKKVLLVLDDLDHTKQFERLAESPDWFGKGSRIIITTRDKHVLTSCEAKIYEMKAMEEDESLQLFSKKAFKKDHPEEDYLELSKSVVAYAGGLPLALEVLGSFLYRRSKDEWADILDKLKQIPNKDILQILKISLDGLDEKEKIIFLDIACFFKGWEKDKVIQNLQCCDLNPTIGIRILIEKTLLVEMINSLGCPILEMHDLLEALGKDIIRQESSNPGNRSRLWEFEDIKEVLEKNKGSEAIEAVCKRHILLDPGSRHKIEVHPKAFSKMNNIRLLIIDSLFHELILPRELELPSALKVVCWPQFSLEALPLPLDKLGHIEMRESNIKQLWNGRQFMKKLKHIDLSYSDDLIETPDFSGVPNLEHLNLEECRSLVKVHPSLGELKRLVEIDLGGCFNLEILPRKLETNSLKRLNLNVCEKVAVLPKFGEGMNELSYLDVSFTDIIETPDFSGVPNLEHLNLEGCKSLVKVHPSLGELKRLVEIKVSRCINLEILPRKLETNSLKRLNLNGCKKVAVLPKFGEGMNELSYLDVSFTDIIETPDFSGVPNLERLNLEECKSLVKVHPSLGELKRLVEIKLNGCINLEILPRKLETNSLKRFNLNGCKKVAVLPKFGEGMNELSYIDVSFIDLDSLTVLEYSDLGGCKILHLDKLKTPIVRQISSFNVTSLTELYLDGCGLNDGSILDNFGGLSSLIALDLGGNSFVNLPSGCFSGLSRLLYLFLDYCKRLKSLPWLPPRLIRLSAVGCDSMEALSDGELWNLVASRDHENRGRIEYANADEIEGPVGVLMFKDVKSECLPQRDFIAIVPAGCEIPSWFTSTEFHLLDAYGHECEIKVEIPQHFRASEWLGIVVCIQFDSYEYGKIWWSSKGAEDADYIRKEWAHAISGRLSSTKDDCMKLIMVLELNEKTCWQHLTPPNNSLHILLSTRRGPFLSDAEIKGCGCRLICKEEMKEWSPLNDLFTQPPTPRQVKLSERLLRKVVDRTGF